MSRICAFSGKPIGLYNFAALILIGQQGRVEFSPKIYRVIDINVIPLWDRYHNRSELDALDFVAEVHRGNSNVDLEQIPPQQWLLSPENLFADSFSTEHFFCSAGYLMIYRPQVFRELIEAFGGNEEYSIVRQTLEPYVQAALNSPLAGRSMEMRQIAEPMNPMLNLIPGGKRIVQSQRRRKK